MSEGGREGGREGETFLEGAATAFPAGDTGYRRIVGSPSGKSM